MYIQYNFTCEQGEVAYLTITTIDMEGETCMDPNFNRRRYYVYYYLG